MIEVGAMHTQTWIVKPSHLASAFGSGLVDVLATPVLVGFCEECSRQIVDPTLPDGQRTVGTSVSVEHLAPTPEGWRVTVTAKLVQVDGRRLAFEFEVSDDVELVARGTHSRFVVDDARFAASLASKRTRLRPA
ncbi:MAG: thioesterase family protein [Candidatus Bipolaricaulota bacterium]